MILESLAVVFLFVVRLRFSENLYLIQAKHSYYGKDVGMLICKSKNFNYKHSK